MFANGSRRVQRGVAKCKAPRGEASRLVPVLVPRRCDDHFIPFIPSSIITRSNAAQAPTYITVVEGLGLSPYNLLVGAQILKQVYTACFGLLKSTCTVLYRCVVLYSTVQYIRTSTVYTVLVLTEQYSTVLYRVIVPFIALYTLLIRGH